MDAVNVVTPPMSSDSGSDGGAPRRREGTRSTRADVAALPSPRAGRGASNELDDLGELGVRTVRIDSEESGSEGDSGAETSARRQRGSGSPDGAAGAEGSARGSKAGRPDDKGTAGKGADHAAKAIVRIQSLLRRGSARQLYAQKLLDKYEKEEELMRAKQEAQVADALAMLDNLELERKREEEALLRAAAKDGEERSAYEIQRTFRNKLVRDGGEHREIVQNSARRTSLSTSPRGQKPEASEAVIEDQEEGPGAPGFASTVDMLRLLRRVRPHTTIGVRRGGHARDKSRADAAGSRGETRGRFDLWEAKEASDGSSDGHSGPRHSRRAHRRRGRHGSDSESGKSEASESTKRDRGSRLHDGPHGGKEGDVSAASRSADRRPVKRDPKARTERQTHNRSRGARTEPRRHHDSDDSDGSDRRVRHGWAADPMLTPARAEEPPRASRRSHDTAGHRSHRHTAVTRSVLDDIGADLGEDARRVGPVVELPTEARALAKRLATFDREMLQHYERTVVERLTGEHDVSIDRSVPRAVAADTASYCRAAVAMGDAVPTDLAGLQEQGRQLREAVQASAPRSSSRTRTRTRGHRERAAAAGDYRNHRIRHREASRRHRRDDSDEDVDSSERVGGRRHLHTPHRDDASTDLRSPGSSVAQAPRLGGSPAGDAQRSRGSGESGFYSRSQAAAPDFVERPYGAGSSGERPSHRSPAHAHQSPVSGQVRPQTATPVLSGSKRRALRPVGSELRMVAD